MMAAADRIPGSFAQDVRFAGRLLAKSPGFACAASLILALGIAGNTALFSLVDCLLLRPVPYPDSDRLVVVWSRPPKGGVSNVSAGNFLDLRDRNRVFEHMSAATPAQFNVSVEGV
ncbi:MAG: hypothetical protein IT158_29850, partial [Bryobacterales bacterium]|nr:hypothetical protein [Bryobacterales bacterium]